MASSAVRRLNVCAASEYDYDLLIIGCGVGGHGCAIHAVERGECLAREGPSAHSTVRPCGQFMKHQYRLRDDDIIFVNTLLSLRQASR